MDRGKLRFFCIDLKSFYASVECVERGLDPLTADLVVCDETRGNGTICLAVSPHMKALGVKNRCRVFEIPKNLEYIKAMPRMQLYIDYSARIYAIYLKYLAPEDIHVYSVDEAFFDGEPYRKLYGMDIPALTEKIQADIKATTGITSTCGMGTNLYLAKVAMDIMAKHSPDFRAQLDEEEYMRKLGEHRPLRDFWMVGRGTERRLNSVGIFTMNDIRRADRQLLLKLIGRNASYLIDHAFGTETVTMEEIKSYRSPAHSLSSNQVLFRDYDLEEGRIVLLEMVDALTLDLTEAGLVTEDLGLFVGYSEGFSAYVGHFTGEGGKKDGAGTGRGALEEALVKGYSAGSVHLPAATDSRRIITEALERLYLEKAQKGIPIRRVGIAFENVRPRDSAQFSLFLDTKKAEKDRALQEGVLSLKKRFGKNSVLFGMDLLDCGTTQLRNGLIGGHKA